MLSNIFFISVLTEIICINITVDIISLSMYFSYCSICWYDLTSRSKFSMEFKWNSFYKINQLCTHRLK